MGEVIYLGATSPSPTPCGSGTAADDASVAWERYCVLMRPLVDDPALLFDRARAAAALMAERAFRAAFLRLEVATVLQRDQ